MSFAVGLSVLTLLILFATFAECRRISRCMDELERLARRLDRHAFDAAAAEWLAVPEDDL